MAKLSNSGSTQSKVSIKLSNADRNRLLARSLFVNANQPKDQIAQQLEVGIKTIENYRIKDKKEGYDWLSLRASKTIIKSQEEKENMYVLFTEYMMQSLKEVRENENLSPTQKTQMIVSLGDSFSKMGKVARQEDPEAYKFGIIKHTTKTILEALKNELPKETMEKIIEVIYDIQDELGNVAI